MSLFTFFESIIEKNPDLAIINYVTPINYDQYYYLYRLQEKRFDIEAFLNPLFFDNLVKCSATTKEFEDLKLKLRSIAQVSQKLFNLSLLNDKIEKEKHSELIKSIRHNNIKGENNDKTI